MITGNAAGQPLTSLNTLVRKILPEACPSLLMVATRAIQLHAKRRNCMLALHQADSKTYLGNSATVGSHDLVIVGGALIQICELCERLRVGRLVHLRICWNLVLHFGKRLCSRPDLNVRVQRFVSLTNTRLRRALFNASLHAPQLSVDANVRYHMPQFLSVHSLHTSDCPAYVTAPTATAHLHAAHRPHRGVLNGKRHNSPPRSRSQPVYESQ
jgi:hypothetical protein